MSNKYIEIASQTSKLVKQQLMHDYDLRYNQIQIAINLPGMGYPSFESIFLKSSIDSITTIVVTRTRVIIPRASLTPEYLNEFVHLVWAARKIFESNILMDFERIGA